MVKRAHIRNGKVVNVSIADQLAPGEIDGTNARISDDYSDGQFTPATRVMPVPRSVTPRQFRRALSKAGLRDAVEAAVAKAGEDVKDAWEYAVTIERANPMLTTMAKGLDISDAQLDDLFRSAARL